MPVEGGKGERDSYQAMKGNELRGTTIRPVYILLKLTNIGNYLESSEKKKKIFKLCFLKLI